jgi:hypothetical protein
MRYSHLPVLLAVVVAGCGPSTPSEAGISGLFRSQQGEEPVMVVRELELRRDGTALLLERGRAFGDQQFERLYPGTYTSEVGGLTIQLRDHQPTQLKMRFHEKGLVAESGEVFRRSAY